MFRRGLLDRTCRNFSIEAGEHLIQRIMKCERIKYGKAVIHVCVFAALLLCLYLLTVLLAAIPNQAIKKNMTASAMYELTVDRYEIPENGSFQMVADNYADQIWLNIAWQMGNGNSFVAALDTGYYDGGNFGVAAGLHQAVTRGKTANQSYTRYWHGSAAFLRLLHLWTDVQGIKTAGLVCLLILVFATVWMLFRQRHGTVALCLLASLLAVQIWQVRLSVEYLPSVLVCFGLCPAFLKLEKNGDFPLELLSVAAGVLTAFFDFLTVETVTVLAPLILVVAVRSMDGRLGRSRDTAMLLLRCLLCWALAYGGTFAVKWICASRIIGDNHISSAISSAGKRLDGTVLVSGVETKPGVLLSIGANLSVLFGGTDRTSSGRILFGLFLFASALCGLCYVCHTRKTVAGGTGFILILGALVFVRYGLLANHSYLHAFFTYRALLSTILAVLVALVLNICPVKKKGLQL